MDGPVVEHEVLVRKDTDGAFFAALAVLRGAACTAILMRDHPEQIAELDELDLLIPEHDLATALAALGRQGWELIQCGVSAPCKRTLGLLHEGRLLRLDIHHELVQDGLIYGDAAWFVDTSHEDGDGLRRPSPEALLYHVVLHVVLGKKSLADKHRTAIQDILNGTCDLSAVRDQAERVGLGAVVDEALADPMAVLSDPARVARLRRRARRALVRARPGNLARHALCWWTRTLGPLFGVRKGFAIAIIGPDGAGKTTFIAEFRRQMEAIGLPTREAYMGPWDRSIMPTSRFLNWLGASPRDHIPGTEASVARSRRISKLIKGLIKRYLYYLNMPIEFWGRYLTLVFPHMMLARIVVMDRYIYDLEVGHRNRILRNGRLMRRCLVALAPRPRLSLLLANDPHTIWSRKREDALEDITQAMAAYESIAAKRGMVVVTTTVETRELVARFIADHWRDFLRWRLDRPFSR